MPELAGAGPGPPEHPTVEHEPGTETAPEMDVGERVGGGRPQGEPESGGVGVLVEDDGPPERPGEDVPYREPVPLRISGDPARRPGRMVQRPGHRDPDAEHDGRAFGTGRTAIGTGWVSGTGCAVGAGRAAGLRTGGPAPSRGATAPTVRCEPRAREQFPHLADRHGQHGLGARAQVEGARRVTTGAPARSTRTAVSSSRSRCSPTAQAAEGTSRSTVRGLPPVEAR